MELLHIPSAGLLRGPEPRTGTCMLHLRWGHQPHLPGARAGRLCPAPRAPPHRTAPAPLLPGPVLLAGTPPSAPDLSPVWWHRPAGSSQTPWETGRSRLTSAYCLSPKFQKQMYNHLHNNYTTQQHIQRVNVRLLQRKIIYKCIITVASWNCWQTISQNSVLEPLMPFIVSTIYLILDSYIS